MLIAIFISGKGMTGNLGTHLLRLLTNSLAVRNPSANRSLIAFTAWSSFAHAAVMAVMAFQNADYHDDLSGVGALVIIGVALIVLAPARQSGERVSAAVV